MTSVLGTFERGAARHRRLAADGFNVMRRFWLIGVIGCVLVGGMAVSPLTVATAISLALIVAGACRGLTGLERRVVLTILLVAIGLRVLAILGLFITSDAHHLASFPFDGDGSFLKQRSLWIRNVWLSIPIDSSQFSNAFQDYGWTGYIYVIGYLQYLLGPAPYAVHLFNVSCFVAGSVQLHRMVRTSYGPIAAIVLLLIILFLPTLFMWSISALKESLFFLLLTTCLFGLVQSARGASALQRIVGLAALFLAAAALDTIRGRALFIVAAATALAAVGTFVTKRVYALVLTLLLLTAIGPWVFQRPSVQARVLTRIQEAANVHIGHVRTQGHGYKLLDQRFYSGDRFETMTWDEARRFVVRAVFSLITVPAPWQVSSRSELLFLPQQLIWYCLVLLAVVGSIQGVRGDVFVTWVFIGMSCAGAAAIATNSGNIGTLVRHRDSIVVPFVACLSALGMVSVLSWAGLFTSGRRRGSEDASEPTTAALMTTPKPARFFQQALDSSMSAQGLFRLTRGSLVCASLTAIFRTSVFDRGDDAAYRKSQVDEVLGRVTESSALISALGRALGALWLVWRDGAFASAADRIHALTITERLRLFGGMLLVGDVAAAAVAWFSDYPWPSVFAWIAMVACATGLIAEAGRLEIAWRRSGSTGAHHIRKRS